MKIPPWKNNAGRKPYPHCSVADDSGQYRTKIVRQMRRQIFRQMKQKAE
jgi:hypothetical protein